MKIIQYFLLLNALVIPLFTAQAQNPFEEPKNLQVLPETVKGDQLRQLMRNFSFATGERCTYCHVQVEDENGARMDFESDDMETKKIAREMMKMMGGINRDIRALNRGDDHQYTRVVCTTCHRGQANPFLIEQVMDSQIAEAGTDAAKAKYLELKERYYGGHTYDFTGFTLAEYANSLINGGNIEDALEMAKFSVAEYPKEAYAHQILGNVYMQQENYAAAIAAFEGSLAVNPDQGFVKGLIEQAKEAMEQ